MTRSGEKKLIETMKIQKSSIIRTIQNKGQNEFHLFVSVCSIHPHVLRTHSINYHRINFSPSSGTNPRRRENVELNVLLYLHMQSYPWHYEAKWNVVSFVYFFLPSLPSFMSWLFVSAVRCTLHIVHVCCSYCIIIWQWIVRSAFQSLARSFMSLLDWFVPIKQQQQQ